ncbi:helix-turn-helix transcriptional regulator [Paenibacillus sp. SI8]|uniref:helix-turn-helix transcriptional regulator n=1 Tax=unclassified Paenibacillus TaxID=185978 RepID=UPI003467D68B
MQWTTVGRKIYPGYHHLMWTDRNEHIQSAEAMRTRYRFMLIEESFGALQIDGQSVPIIAPAIICLNENESLSLVSDSAIAAKTIYFHPLIVNYKFDFLTVMEQGHDWSDTDRQDLWCLRPFRDRSGCYAKCVQIDPMFARHISQIIDEIDEQLTAQPDVSWPCRSRSFMLELLSLVRRLYDRSELQADKILYGASKQIEAIIQYVHANYRQKIKVEDVTRAFNTNKTTLNNQFKEHLGLTMMAYVNAIRMQMASSMLRNTTLSVSEIMQMVGIQDSAHFNRNFRKFTGCTPAEYRNQFCWMLKHK